jgi:hypothetical protein
MNLQSESRPRTGGLPSLGLLIAPAAVLCILVASAAWLGPQTRMWAAFIAVMLLPGAPLVLLSLNRSLGPMEKLAASFVGSLVVLAAASLFSHALGWELTGVLWFIPVATVLSGLAQWYSSRGSHSSGGDDDRDRAGAACDRFPTQAVRCMTWSLLAIAIVWSGRLSGEVGPGTDAFDHIATVREINATGNLFPLTAWYKYPEAPLPDPRKGVFHVGLAAICRYSGQDPVDVWVWLPRALLPVVLLIVFCLGRTLTGSWAGGWLAALFWVLCYGGPNSSLPTQVGYAHNVSEAASWLLIMMMVKYAAGGGRELILASAVGLVACCFVHVSAFVLLLVAWGCLLASVLVLGGDRRRKLAVRLGRVGLVWLVFGLLAAVTKILMSYAPANPVQLQNQNLLYWTSSLYTVNPMWVFGWLGLPGVLAAALALGLAFKSAGAPGRLYLVGACILPLAIVVNPLAVPLLYSIVGYLVERFVWVVPYPHMLALAAVSSYRRVILLRGLLPRLAVALLLIVVVASVVQTAGSRAAVSKEKPLREISWKPALEYLQASVDTASVVASDLLTSYSIPAFTRHRVVSTLHQHGSPNDPRGSDRIVALAEIMGPDTPGETLKERLLDQEVDYIMVNESFNGRLLLHYAEVDPVSLGRLRDKLKRVPRVFREVYDSGGVTIFAVDRKALSRWEPKDSGMPPYLLPAGAKPPGKPIDKLFGGQVELLSVELPGAPVSAGEPFQIICFWQSKAERLEFDIPWVVQIRIQRDYPKGRFYSPAYSKVYRKCLEMVKGESYRMRASHLPARGAFPPSLWGDYIIKDVAEVTVPRDMSTGTYELTVSIGRQPIYPNLTMRDLLRDDDQYSGVAVGTLSVK